MPETRLERVVFGLGLVAIAVLAVVIARDWHRQNGVAAAPVHVTTARASPPTPTRARSAQPTTAQATTAQATTAQATTPATTSPAPVSLALTAARGDSWMEVRDGSSTGAVLYTGTLKAGATKTFRAPEVWARFGQAGELDASLDGRPLQLPVGTYSARFSSGGFQRVRG